MPVNKLPKKSIFEFVTNDFSSDCEKLGRLKKNYINFDEVRKKHWPGLRSVDALEVADLDKEISLIEFCDLQNELADQNKNKNMTGCKNKKELIIERLFSEFSDKAVHSLLILSRYYGIEPEFINYTIVLCSEDTNYSQKHIREITNIKKKLHEKLLSQLNEVIKKPEKRKVYFFMLIESFLKSRDKKN